MNEPRQLAFGQSAVSAPIAGRATGTDAQPLANVYTDRASGAARRQVSPTSKAAYRDSLLSGRVRTHKARALQAIEDAGDEGMTLDEVCVRTGILLQSLCGAMNGLAKDGLIEQTGQVRPTRTGSAAQVWRAAPAVERAA